MNKNMPLANLDLATSSATAAAHRTHHKFQRAHGRVLRLQTLAEDDQPRLLASMLLPPLGVFLELGWSPEVVLNLLLTVLGFIPGLLHVLYLITSD